MSLELSLDWKEESHLCWRTRVFRVSFFLFQVTWDCLFRLLNIISLLGFLIRQNHPHLRIVFMPVWRSKGWKKSPRNSHLNMLLSASSIGVCYRLVGDADNRRQWLFDFFSRCLLSVSVVGVWVTPTTDTDTYFCNWLKIRTLMLKVTLKKRCFFNELARKSTGLDALSIHALIEGQNPPRYARPSPSGGWKMSPFLDQSKSSRFCTVRRAWSRLSRRILG